VAERVRRQFESATAGLGYAVAGSNPQKGAKKEMLPLIATLPGVEIHEKPRALKKKRLQ